MLHDSSTNVYLNSYQLVLICSKPDLYSMLDACSPLCIRVCHMEMIMAFMLIMAVLTMCLVMLMSQILSEHTFLYRRHLIAKICACLIECDRIK